MYARINGGIVTAIASHLNHCMRCCNNITTSNTNVNINISININKVNNINNTYNIIFEFYNVLDIEAIYLVDNTSYNLEDYRFNINGENMLSVYGTPNSFSMVTLPIV